MRTDFDPASIFGWGCKVPIWMSYTYTNATLDGDSTSTDPESIFSGGKDGNQVPYIPENQFNAGIGLETVQWGFELMANYVDATYTTANNSSEHVNPVTGLPDARFGKTDERWIFDCSVKYRLNKSSTLFLNVFNILDEEYVASRHPHGARAGQPRTARVGVELTF